jgi:putative phage-type endonuclease
MALIKLKNIIQSINPPPLFNTEEKKELLSTIYHLFYVYIRNNRLCFSNPQIEEIILDDIHEILVIQFKNIFDYSIDEELIKLIKIAEKKFYSTIIPRRSYPNSFLRKCNKHNLEEKIKIIEEKPQPSQRSEEWYKFRYNLLTASNAWKAFGSQSSQNQLIYEKCLPLNINKYNMVSTESTLHWGQKYEPISIMLYEYMCDTKIKDFGCVPHSIYKFLAASPDGINICKKSLLYGRMLEIKNIVNRQITGIPKEEYWIQMQLQMETCNLNECDFLETRFVEYESEEEFNADGSFCYTQNKDPKGIILYFMTDGKPYYEYAPLFLSKDNFDIWENEMMEKHKSDTWVKTIYWHMPEMSCVLVLRNKIWFEEAINNLDNIWNIIEKERIEGYSHRAPRRNQSVKKSIYIDSISKKKECYINIQDLSSNNIIFTPQKDTSVFNIDTVSLQETQEQLKDSES